MNLPGLRSWWNRTLQRRRARLPSGESWSTLHQRLLGVTVASDSQDVEAAFQLFVEIWDRKRRSEGGRFDEGVRCSIDDDLFLERIADDTWEFSKWGHSRLNDRGWDLIDDIDRSDPSHVARTWVVVLAYLLTDYRYLHF